MEYKIINKDYEKIFDEYTLKFDINNKNSQDKINHIKRVRDCAYNIAKSLNLNDEEIEVATLIGLLHDIGRFEEYKLKSEGIKPLDHGTIGVEVLSKNDFLNQFVNDNKYNDIIKKAIINHNRFEIEDGLDDYTLKFCKIIRDADKLDIFYEGVFVYYMQDDEIQNVNKSIITNEIYNEFNRKVCVKRVKDMTPCDKLLNFLSFAFDLNFEYTKNKIVEEKYIERLVDKFNIEDINTNSKIKDSEKLVLEYLKVK